MEKTTDRAADNSTLIAIARAVKLKDVTIARKLKAQLTKSEHRKIAEELISGANINSGSAKFYQMLAI